MPIDACMLGLVEHLVRRDELGRFVQREVHLNVTAAVVDSRIALADVGGQHRGIEQIVDGQIGRQRRDDDRRGHRLARLGAHPADLSVADHDLGHLGAQPHLATVALEHVDQMRGERADSTA